MVFPGVAIGCSGCSLPFYYMLSLLGDEISFTVLGGCKVACCCWFCGGRGGFVARWLGVGVFLGVVASCIWVCVPCVVGRWFFLCTSLGVALCSVVVTSVDLL
jgi:hypothetical protein